MNVVFGGMSDDVLQFFKSGSFFGEATFQLQRYLVERWGLAQSKTTSSAPIFKGLLAYVRRLTPDADDGTGQFYKASTFSDGSILSLSIKKSSTLTLEFSPYLQRTASRIGVKLQ